jgi:hypothetical protein
MAVQFTLSRMFQLVAVVAILCSLFASLPWPIAMAVLSVANVMAAIVFFVGGRSRTSNLASVTSLLVLATLFSTDWGLSSLHPVVHVAWPIAIAACAFQLATILAWFLFYHR